MKYCVDCKYYMKKKPAAADVMHLCTHENATEVDIVDKTKWHAFCDDMRTYQGKKYCGTEAALFVPKK